MKNLFLIPLAFLMLFSCSSDDDSSGNGPDPTPENAVRLANSGTFGSVLTNSDGFTLYFFAVDSKEVSNCNGNCADTWPAFFADNLTLDNGLNQGDFGAITREDGSQQNTYKGWPLYTFSGDTAAGNINGDGSGEVWFVAKPDYTIMISKAQLVGRDSSGNETNLTSDFTPGDEQTTYITNASGRTLYSFSNDTNNNNTFTASDFSNNSVWPIYEATLQNIPSILNASGFDTIDVFGRQQLTYKGWPLYYFGQDTERGDNYGVGFPTAGIWPTLNQDSDAAPDDEASSIVFNVTNQGASAYLFTGDGLNNVANPDITLTRGQAYEFVVNSPGHPFFLKSVQSTGTGNAFNNGVTNNGNSQGTVTFTVPDDAPNTLFYNCEFHGSMTGTFTIID